jgi:gliding motility-associated-like protein
MLKYIYLYLFLMIFSPINSQIIQVRNVCVGTIVEVKTSDFTCAGLTTVPGITGNTADLPLFRSDLSNRSTTIQLNKVGTYFFFLACSNNVTQRIQINFVDCDTALCLGPNLVPNPSFETIQNCINPRASLTGVTANWLDYPLLSPTNKGSVDFYHIACDGGGFAGILADNPPRTGKGMIGAFVFRRVDEGSGLINAFEYPVAPLTEPLVVGQQYRVRFFAKYPNGYSAANRISAGFVVGDPSVAFRSSSMLGYDYIGEAPKASSNNYISEAIFWSKIEGVFTADKPYTHLIIGNLGGLSTSLNNVPSYYVFDDFSVQLMDNKIQKELNRVDTIVCKGHTASLGIKTSASKTSLKNLTTAQTIVVDTSRLITLPNVINPTCYQFFFERNGCRDSLNFCVNNHPNADTLVYRFSCKQIDTGLIIKQLKTFRGCDSTVRIQTNLTFKDTTKAIQFVCNKADTGSILIKLRSVEGCDSFVLANRKWVKSDTTNLELLSCFPKDTGLVIKNLSNRFNCDSILLIKTKLTAPTLINLGNDTAVDIGSRLKLMPILRGDSAKTILWQPPLGLSCTNCLNPELILTHSARYSLTITNSGGCVSKAEKLIKAIDKPFVYVPNAFSPNGDNINEILTVYANTNRVEMIKKFSIYDRWGNLIFNKKDFLPNDESAGWDGLFNGNKVGQDVFIYVVEFMLFDKQIKIVSGDVTIMR